MSLSAFARGALADAFRSLLRDPSAEIESVESVVRAHIQLLDLTHSPYGALVRRPCASFRAPTAVAAEFSGAIYTPGRSSILEINQIVIRNSDAAAQSYTVRITSGAINNLTAQGDAFNFTDLAPQRDVSQNSEATLSSFAQAYSSAASQPPGSRIVLVSVPAGESLIVPMPAAVFLRGDLAHRAGVWAVTANIGFTVTVQGHEWPL